MIPECRHFVFPLLLCRKAVLGVQGHGVAAWVPQGHHPVRHRHAVPERRRRRVVEGRGQDVFI